MHTPEVTAGVQRLDQSTAFQAATSSCAPPAVLKVGFAVVLPYGIILSLPMWLSPF